MSPETQPPEFYAGPPVDAKDLRFREAFLNDLWEHLKNKHVLLTSPRRTGKTSIMDYLRHNPPEGTLAIYVNVQDLSHPAELFESILDAFHDRHPAFVRDNLTKGWGLLKQAFGKIEKFEFWELKIAPREGDPNWRENWRQHGEAFLKEVRKNESQVLIIIDELPDMILNMRKQDTELLRDFLAWFRTQRQNPNPAQDSVRWLVGGSINLSGTLDSSVTLPVM